MASILIVDDVADNRQLLVEVLRQENHRIVEATDGREALAAVQAERPDLVITDVLMPVMDGYEFVRQLHLDPATRSIPVVFHTAHYGAREARELAISRGVSYVLAKPAEPEEFLEIVRRGLAGGFADPPYGALTSSPEIDREHIRLVTSKLSETDQELRVANARLHALLNIGVELAAEQDTERMLLTVCTTARELLGAISVSVGIIDLADGTLRRFANCGAVSARWPVLGDVAAGVVALAMSERRIMRGVNPGGAPAPLGLPALDNGVEAFLVAPLASPSNVYGWICFVGSEGRRFTDADGTLVMALSGNIGRIYESNYLHAVATERNAELEREIAARHEAEVELRAARDRAQCYLDTAEVILVAIDRTGRITLANRYACDVFGWSADELLGRDYIDTCIPAGIRAEMRLKLQTVIDGSASSIAHNAIVTRSGEERMIEWRNTLLRDGDGHIVGALSSGIDRTEQQRAAEALRLTEERTRFALQNAGIGIWDINYVTGELRWSEILEAQYGLPRGGFAGTFDAFAARIHPDDRACALAAFENAAASGADFSLQHRTVWDDGTVHWLRGAGRVHLNASREPVRGVGISMDITEHRVLEEQVQQAQKMEAIGRLAGGVAHDFNNLLTAILGYCELVLQDLAPDDQHRGDIVEIQKAGVSAAALTRQLLAFSRKQIIEPELLDLNSVVRDMHALLQRLIGADVQIELSLSTAPALVTADHAQMEQVVMNLAVNARDAMPSGGTLTLATSLVELHEHHAKSHPSVKPGAYVALTVTDTGTGISPVVLAQLFEPFFTTKPVGEGTGLGLATVHGIAARSGGGVSVSSEAEVGSSFTVYFPRARDGEVVEEVAPPVAGPRAATQTILVVDDAEELRDLTRRLLEHQGYTVLVARSAEEAHQVLADHPAIDLLLTDVVMPGRSGAELSEKWVARLPRLKVIYMSGYTEDAITQRGVVNPGIAFLHKPFTSESLARKIREVLD